MSEAELFSLFIESSQALDNNFEFWLTISFALIVASYLVTERIPFSVFFTAAFLYLTSTAIFMIRGATMGQTLSSVRDELQALNSEISTIGGNANFAVAALYFVVMIVGSAGTISFVHWRFRRLRRSPDA